MTLLKPLILKRGKILLRDRTYADLANHRRWLTTETSWLDWDAPWVKSDPQWDEQYLARIERQLAQPPPDIRSTLEICLRDGTHVGMVNAYRIDGDPKRLAAGIGIRESSYWGQGLGTDAFLLWLGYLFIASGPTKVYCETWSGNIPMIKLASKAGFRRSKLLRNFRLVRGQFYHSLTYALSHKKFLAKYPEFRVLEHPYSSGGSNDEEDY